MKKIVLFVSILFVLSFVLVYNIDYKETYEDITPSQRLSVMQTSEKYTPSQNLAIIERRFVDAYNSIELMNG